MKKIKFVLFLSAVLPIHALAACTATTNDGRDYFIVAVNGFNPPPFSPGDIPIGGIIYEAKADALTFTNAINPWDPVTTCSFTFRRRITGVGIPDASKIYPTNIPNVGLRIISPLGEVAPFTSTGLPIAQVYWNIYYAPKIQLIKTGNVTESGVLSGAYANYRVDNDAGQLLVEYRFAAPVLVTPKVPSCTVTTPRIQVPMGETMASTVFTGVGSSAPSRSFGIDLSCSGGDRGTTAKVYVTLTDATNPGNTSTTLSLSKDSTATGVGLQILKGDDVLGYGPASSAIGNTNQWLGGSVAQGAAGLSIALRARYVQTSPRIKSGTANAIANFTMSYQ
ncbi:fimbrial protein [Burkholderia sp. AU16741]|uniref:fimbrial protein n=1 Tax=unclassified Burkholderia TaxID=2613784 RepID=UPI000B7A71CA|nr:MULTISPECIES: fimbrial protein [unclassified Burkholderia]MDN7425961.1 fimbrial protein [Burkholderia sp. AU45388]OXI31289.1 fimbrial protein [Burkholderia sp. AU16741]